MESRRLCYIAAITGAWLLYLAGAPAPFGLAPPAWRAVALLFLAVFLWLTEAIDIAITGFLLICLLVFYQVMPFEAAIAGFASETLWTLTGILVMSFALEETGLHRRLALQLLRFSGGQTDRILFLFMVLGFVLAFFIPNGQGRVALLLPLAMGMVNAMGLQGSSNIAKGIFIAIPFVSDIVGSAVISGSMGAIYTNEILQTMAGRSLSYTQWLCVAMPGALVSTLSLWKLLLHLFPPEIKCLPEGGVFFTRELASLGPISSREKRIAFLYAILILTWVTTEWHRLSMGLVSVAVATVAMLPGIGVVSWKRATANLKLNVLVLFASGLAVGRALKDSGAMEWLVGLAQPLLGHQKPLVLAFLTILAFALLRLVFLNRSAMVAAMMPVVVSLAFAVGVDPVWLAMIALIATGMSFFLPVQSASNIITFSSGYFTTAEFFCAGVATAIMFVLVTMLTIWVYWPRLGLVP